MRCMFASLLVLASLGNFVAADADIDELEAEQDKQDIASSAGDKINHHKITGGVTEFQREVLSSTKFSLVRFGAQSSVTFKKLKPDWDRLAEYYNLPDSSAQIVTVGCSVKANIELCAREGVTTYGIKYYDSKTGPQGEKTFTEGTTDYNALKNFVKSKMKPMCILKTLAGCSSKERNFIKESKFWDQNKTDYEYSMLKRDVGTIDYRTEHVGATLKGRESVTQKHLHELDVAWVEARKAVKQHAWKMRILNQYLERISDDEWEEKQATFANPAGEEGDGTRVKGRLALDAMDDELEDEESWEEL